MSTELYNILHSANESAPGNNGPWQAKQAANKVLDGNQGEDYRGLTKARRARTVARMDMANITGDI